MSTEPDHPTVVVVHGALTEASVWHPVIAELQRRGHEVLAPAMPMRSLAADAAYLHSVLATIPGPIVLAGHSYGGSVISHPAAITPAVGALAFVAVFQQDAGETAGELNCRFPGSRLTPDTTQLRAYDGGQATWRSLPSWTLVCTADRRRRPDDQ
jgi:pimeloyl-ACP methyl ester carboxylesterase